jgi:hypothetical protein
MDTKHENEPNISGTANPGQAKIKNMGNAGRNGGEYYTPRPLIRAIVQAVQPKIGERISDGAVGSSARRRQRSRRSPRPRVRGYGVDPPVRRPLVSIYRRQDGP